MRAAWYERTGAARDVLVAGELPDPEPAAGEVRVRVAAAGVNPADVKRRAGAGGRTMPGPRIVPGDDGAGTVDAVGPGVPDTRVGERVWVHSANLGRAFGTAAELVVVPSARAVPLPPGVPFEVGACLGVPAMTAHRAVYADGPVDGLTVLVTGGAGAVGHYAIQFAAHGGATVVATASTVVKQRSAGAAGADHVVDYRRDDAAASIAEQVGPVDRVVDVDLGANLPLTAAVVATGATVAAYGSDRVPEPALPFYPLMRRGVTIRLVSVFAMPAAACRRAIDDITARLGEDALSHPIAARHPLEAVVDAHEDVERGAAIGKVLVIPPAARAVRARPRT